ncbi:phage tail sheath subtilisin-like domain-containing protein [Streptomyces sp. NPDC002763]|uniref:phage tail sheath subtilisin-like domain-containing protein n=1 Tax=Streptomyces sp. NPDC002763 TaxID=3154427 RepID=UPI00332077E2
MPQYLAPGVYVEEVAGPRTIQGVSTSTAAFIGPTRSGPTSGRPELLTSYADFTRVYGDAVDLEFEDAGRFPNYLALGVKGFFDEGGSSLYVMRTFARTDADAPEDDHGVGSVPRDTDAVRLSLRARFPGQAGNLRVTLTLRAGTNALTAAGDLTRVREFDTVWATRTASDDKGVFTVRRDTTSGAWTLTGGAFGLPLDEASGVYPLTALVEVQHPTVDAQGLPAFGPPQAVGEFGFDPRAVGTGITTVLTANPPTRRAALSVPIAVEGVAGLGQVSPDDLPRVIATALFDASILETSPVATTPLQLRQRVVTLTGGSDGNAPDVTEYEGDPTGFADYQNNPTALPFNGLPAFEAVDDISIVAAPGSSTGWNRTTAAQGKARAIANAVINHSERMVYRVAALDTPPGFLPDEALDYRNQRSSTHAALYYPWITVSSPLDGSRVDVPPAAYMAGIWARSDTARGVIKAPANEVVRSALDFETRLNKSQQELLNPQGVNCLRFFPGPGFLVWGARTISDDPEWKYLSIRRYFNFLEKSIDQGTQWVVFEVNGPALWDAVRHTVEGFLFNEWKSGALLGAKPEQAYFVRCDASTMTADDLDNGRLICVVGVAAAKPAEFVVFRISQWTATQTA